MRVWWSVLRTLCSLAIATSVSAQESLVRCRVTGGMLPFQATTVECFETGGATYIRSIHKPYDQKPLSRVAPLKSSDYEELWRWIEKHRFWTLKDVDVAAEDAESYFFELKRGHKQIKITAVAAGTLEDKRYYRLFQKLMTLRERYFPQTEKGGNK